MEPIEIGLIVSGGMLVLVILGMRVAFAAGLAGLVGLIWIFWAKFGYAPDKFEKALAVAVKTAGQVPHSKVSSQALSLIPTFILIGYLAYYAGLTRALFEAATLRLSHLEAAGLGTLTDTIAEAVKTLAAQRAGQMIDEMPAPFVKRVEALADRVAQGVAAVTVRLNPDDFAAIKPHLAGSDLLDPDRIGPDDSLARGDVDIRSGAVQLRDVLFPRGAA